MKKHKLLLLIMTAVLILPVVGCGKKDDEHSWVWSIFNNTNNEQETEVPKEPMVTEPVKDETENKEATITQTPEDKPVDPEQSDENEEMPSDNVEKKDIPYYDVVVESSIHVDGDCGWLTLNMKDAMSNETLNEINKQSYYRYFEDMKQVRAASLAVYLDMGLLNQEEYDAKLKEINESVPSDEDYAATTNAGYVFAECDYETFQILSDAGSYFDMFIQVDSEGKIWDFYLMHEDEKIEVKTFDEFADLLQTVFKPGEIQTKTFVIKDGPATSILNSEEGTSYELLITVEDGSRDVYLRQTFDNQTECYAEEEKYAEGDIINVEYTYTIETTFGQMIYDVITIEKQ